MTNLIVSLSLFYSTVSYACVPAFFFSGVPGKYDVAFTSGGQTFRDQLDLSSMTKHPGMASLREYLQGSYVSATFKSELISGVVELTKVGAGPETDLFDLSFAVQAKEGGKTYAVYFLAHGNTKDTCEMKGQAFLDAEHAQPIADIVLEKQDRNDCRCY